METIPCGSIVQGVQVGFVDHGPIVGFVACAYMAPHAGLKLLSTCHKDKRVIRRMKTGFPSRANIPQGPEATRPGEHPTTQVMEAV